jgi:thioesterase domain-containing protein
MADLEKIFNVPVIESYGMTEAAHQITSNPLPPGKRKAGSVGIASGPEVAIIDDEGRLLTRGLSGEIVIRGLNVTRGYENNSEANKKAFTNGWFRTGDQGYLGEDDYLVITNRIKEIINRGGEKISPREVDEVLLSHPSVAQAVTFAVPDPKLGEDVGAAVVLRESATASEWEIQRFVASRLADFKVPRRIVILDEIPKGSTGKIQRIGLAEKLGLVTSIDGEKRAKYKAPRSLLEKMLAEIWSQILEVERIGVDDNFFQLGGDSIQARLIISRLCEALQIERIPVVVFLHAPTIEKMARILGQREFSFPTASLTAVQRTGSRPPFYCVHACEGEVLFLADLAHHLGSDQPFYALRAQGLDGKTTPHTRVEDMATHYLKEIEAFQPEGPYFLGGAGVGGIVAWEMAQRLIAQTKKVGLLVLMDTVLPRSLTSAYYLRRMLFYTKRQELFKIVRTFMRDKYRQLTHNIPGVPNYRVWEQTQKAGNRYAPKIYQGRVILFMSERREGFPDDPRTRIDPWRRFVTGAFNAHVVAGEHLDIFKEPNVQAMARQLRLCLAEAIAADTR